MKIYLSSPFEDLKAHREAVSTRLRQMRHDVVQMETYVAAGPRAAELCVRDVKSCDLYVGVFAWRYGSVPKGWEQSVSELEYRAAVEKDADRVLIFLADDHAPWPPSMMDWHSGENDGGARIRALRQELQDAHTVRFFTSPEHLAGEVVVAVSVLRDYMVPTPVATAVAASTPAPPALRSAKRVKKAAAAPREGYPLLWRPGDTLRVRFLDGNEKQKEAVKRFAPEWSEFANLSFEFGDDPNAELRVSFANPGSWAFMGAQALGVKKEPTINFGWLTASTPEAEARGSVLHELGHVLGLYHEHQNPNADIPWDKEAVYNTFSRPPNNWPREQIERLMFKRYDRDYFPIEKPFDPKSIMAYAMPRELMTNDFEIGVNKELSAGDKEFVAKLYPFH